MTALGEAAEAAIKGSGEVTVQDGSGRRATLHVRDADRLAVELEGIDVHAPADLGDRAGHLARELRPGGERLQAFEIDPRRREGLLKGLDEVALTLQRDSEIHAFQASDRTARPWIHSTRISA